MVVFSMERDVRSPTRGDKSEGQTETTWHFSTTAGGQLQACVKRRRSGRKSMSRPSFQSIEDYNDSVLQSQFSAQQSIPKKRMEIRFYVLDEDPRGQLAPASISSVFVGIENILNYRLECSISSFPASSSFEYEGRQHHVSTTSAFKVLNSLKTVACLKSDDVIVGVFFNTRIYPAESWEHTFGEADPVNRLVVISAAAVSHGDIGHYTNLGRANQTSFLKVLIHEVYHVLGLSHCNNFCRMRPAHTLDVLSSAPLSLCEECAVKANGLLNKSLKAKRGQPSVNV